MACDGVTERADELCSLRTRGPQPDRVGSAYFDADHHNVMRTTVKSNNSCPEARLRAVFQAKHASLEWWLQAYFHRCIRPQVLPPNAILIAFEETPDGSNRTQQGVCDLVYRDGCGRLYIVETKIIDSVCGRTARSRRKRKRNALWEQLARYARLFAHHGNGQEPILIAMTTDPSPSLMPGTHCRVSSRELRVWIAAQAS